MLFTHPYSHTILLGALLLGRHVAGAPIPLPMLTHVDGETSIWVTSHNTLNASAPLSGRSLGRRQGPGGFGPPGGAPGGAPGAPGQTFGPPGENSFGPPGGNPFDPQEGPNPGWPGNTLFPTEWSASPQTTFETTSAIATSIPPPPPTSTSVPFTPPAVSTPATGVSSTSPALSTSTSAPASSPSASTPVPFPTSSLSPPPSSPPASPTSIPPPPSSPTSIPTSSAATSIPTSSASTSIPPPATTSTIPPPSSTSTQPASSSSPSGVATSSISSSSTTSAPPAPSGTGGAGGGNTLQVSLVNNLGSSNVHAYVTGLDSNGQVVMLTTSGSYYNVPSPGTTTPQAVAANVALPLNGPGQTTTITLPDYISSARVWFADGNLNFYVVDTQYGPGLVEPTAMNPNDPSADVNWGFVELTFKSGYGLFANLSFVDFVGLPLGMKLQASSGTQSALGLPANAATEVCNLLKGQATKDGQPWDQLCVNDANGNLLRVVSPPTLISQNASAFSNYFDKYVNNMWSYYAGKQLMINTQGDAGEVACSSDGTTITCAGSTGSYTKPSSEDIFGCNTGPFAISQSDNSVHLAVVPRLCAAFNRATLHLPGGNVQPSLPPSDYYKAHPNNYYSAFVHKTELDGRGYAFSYDDVSPSIQDDTSGSVYAPDPQVLTVYIGGSSS